MALDFQMDVDDFDNPDDPAKKDDEREKKYSILRPMDISELKLPQFQIDKMLASYEEVCVQDFGDIYHMPEDERRQMYQYYDAFKNVRRIKTKYRKLDKFILAYREMLKCLNVVAEDNMVYEKDEFIKLVLKKKITVSGLVIPKLIGKENRDLNWEMVSEYIVNTDLDPSELIHTSNERYWDGTSETDIEEVEDDIGCDIIDYLDTVREKSDVNPELFDPDEDDATGKNIIIPLTKKEQKLAIKKDRSLLMGIQEAKKSHRASSRFTGYAYELTSDAFEEISDIDAKRGNGIPQFKGDIFNPDDYHRYLQELEEYEDKHVYITINNRTYTVEQAEEMVLKDYLESCGIDLRKFKRYSDKEKKERKQVRDEKKKIKRMKKKLQNMQKRVEDRESKGKVNSKKKNKKKGKKSGKRMNGIIPNAYSSFEDYAADMEEGWD